MKILVSLDICYKDGGVYNGSVFDINTETPMTIARVSELVTSKLRPLNGVNIDNLEISINGENKASDFSIVTSSLVKYKGIIDLPMNISDGSSKIARKMKDAEEGSPSKMDEIKQKLGTFLKKK
jgi:hypothetical protein